MKFQHTHGVVLFSLRLLVGAITALLLLTAYIAPKKITQLHPSDNTVLMIYDDRVKPDGKSEATWLDTQNYRYGCSLRAGDAYPHCGVSVKFYKEPNAKTIYDGNPDIFNDLTPYDLSSYDGLLVDFDYSGSAEKLRFFLRDAIDEKVDFRDIWDQKLSFAFSYRNEFTQKDSIYIDFQAFTVADWWLEEFGVDRRYAKPTFERILEINFDTPANTPFGEHEFVLNRVAVVGDRIPPEVIYWTIIGLWLMVLCVEAGQRFYAMATMARNYRARLESLEQDNRTLKESANRDVLTGLYNRRGLEMIAQLIWADKKSSSTAVLLFDVDHFKAVNDAHGHLAGDEILKQFAELLQKNIRHSDKLARWGGEEFVMISQQNSLQTAISFADTLRQTIEQHTFVLPTEAEGVKPLSLTCSVGVAMIRKGHGFEAILGQVDSALYAAKGAGRNQVVSG